MIKKTCRVYKPRGFTLVELLIALAVIGLLAALAFPALGQAIHKARLVQCTATLSKLGKSLHAYILDHDGTFPRSFHSAGSYSEPGWSAAVAPYMGLPAANTPAEWTAQFNSHYRCPEHNETDPLLFSYALNVHFELDPLGDSYAGSPRTWRRLAAVPDPGKTIFVAETRPTYGGDHVMSHLWVSPAAAQNALSSRHEGRPNFLFVDGSVRSMRPEETFAAGGVNLWNPSLAGE